MKTLGRHKNIIHLLGVSHVDGTPSIIMPWMEQGSLYDILRLKPPKTARDQWVGAFSGRPSIDTFHSHATGNQHNAGNALPQNLSRRSRRSKKCEDGLHYAIKGYTYTIYMHILKANVLIHRDGTARIADFGLSRRVSPASVSRFALKTERVLSLFRSPIEDDCFLSDLGAGSSRWAAPENLHPEKWGRSCPQTTFESDVFALAMVFYEVLHYRISYYRWFILTNFPAFLDL